MNLKKFIKGSELLGVTGFAFLLLILSCGKAKDAVNEITNEQRIKGHWLMTESEHAGTVSKAIQNESMVLTFKDSKAAFSPTDSVKGRAVYATLGKCFKEVRDYEADKNQIVFKLKADCPEKRITIQQLDDSTLKFPDPDKGDITRVFTKIDQSRYDSLVKASDRRP